MNADEVLACSCLETNPVGGENSAELNTGAHLPIQDRIEQQRKKFDVQITRTTLIVTSF